MPRRRAIGPPLSGHALRSQLLRGGIGSGVVKVSGTLLSLVVALALARIMGSEGYGIYAYVFALMTFLTIPAQFGLPQLVVRETARAHASDDWPAIRGIWRWSGLVAVLASVMVAVLGVGAAWWFAERFSTVQLATFAWGLVLVPLLIFARLRGASLRGLRHVVAGQAPDTVVRPLLLCLFVVTLYGFSGDALGPDSAMGLHVAATALAVAFGEFMLHRARPPEAGAASTRYEHRAWARAVMPLGLTAGMMLINRHADILLLGFFVAPEEIGVYRIAAQAAMLVAFGQQTVNVIAAPWFTRMHNQGDHQRLQRLVTACARIAFAVALPAALVLVLPGPWLLTALVGAEYGAGATAVAILALGHLASAAIGSVGMLLNMTDHESIVTRTVALAAAGNVLANLALIPIWGMNGAAAATAMTFLAWNLLLARAVRRRLGIDSSALGRRLTP